MPGTGARRPGPQRRSRSVGLNALPRFDAVVIGAGAAGLFCAAQAGQLGMSVLLIDHAERVAEKIRISGGGRCNFTNLATSPAEFISQNPDFCRSALARFTPRDFIDRIERRGIAWHEKHRGQLFCDGSSQQIIDMLLADCAQGNVTHWQPCTVEDVRTEAGRFSLATTHGVVVAARVVIATGGLSIPKIGASDFGYRIARQFGHGVVETRPALVPLLWPALEGERLGTLTGVSLPARVATGQGKGQVEFLEDLLFTHRGLSGPAALQISSYWQPGSDIRIDFAPGIDLRDRLLAAKRSSARHVGVALGEVLPRRFVDAWLQALPALREQRLADCRDRDLVALAENLRAWPVAPSGTEGYRKAEVTVGGIDTRELDSRSFESRRVPGLHFIGEVVDVTGWLGGYNFQWAWASGDACARAMAANCDDARAGL